MGAGQIGGIATLLDIDFNNAAGFLGQPAETTEALYVVYYFSHALMFCAGALIEAHVVLTPAECVHGEKYKFDIITGTHNFYENSGITREVKNYCIHKGYNSTIKWCTPMNLALLVLDGQISLWDHEQGADYIVNRVRYGPTLPVITSDGTTLAPSCRIYGWGSRRNGYLVPLLIKLQRLDVELLPPDHCDPIWNTENKFLCVRQFKCKTAKYGALCPDDIGSIIECDGSARGLMVSRLVDRPCGVGFIDLQHFHKFLTCGVDASRDVVEQNVFEFSTAKTPHPTLVTIRNKDTAGES